MANEWTNEHKKLLRIIIIFHNAHTTRHNTGDPHKVDQILNDRMPYGDVRSVFFSRYSLKGYINTIRICRLSVPHFTKDEQEKTHTKNKITTELDCIRLISRTEKKAVRCTNDEEWHETRVIINGVDKNQIQRKRNHLKWFLLFIALLRRDSHCNGCSQKIKLYICAVFSSS